MDAETMTIALPSTGALPVLEPSWGDLVNAGRRPRTRRLRSRRGDGLAFAVEHAAKLFGWGALLTVVLHDLAQRAVV
jgi:hypothetical protein